MSFSPDNVFFFTQRRRPRIQRRKKLPHELPQAFRYANLNPKIAAYLATKEKEEEGGRSQDDSSRTLGSKSSGGSHPVVELVVPSTAKAAAPPRTETVPPVETESKAHHQPHTTTTPDSDEWDLQRQTYEEFRRCSPTILSRLSQLLYNRPKQHGNIPRFLAYHLESNWKELTADACFDLREWQTLACKEVARQRHLEEEKRRRDQASNTSGDSSHNNQHHGETAEQTTNTAEARKPKKRSGSDHEEGAAGGSSGAEGPSKRGELLPPGMPNLSVRRGSRASSVQSGPRPTGSSSRGQPASTARSTTGGGGGGLMPRSSTSRRGSTLLRVPGTHRSSGSVTAMDEIVSERTSIGGGVSKLCLDKESSTLTQQAQNNAMAQEPSRGYYQTTIQFLLSSRECDEKGWIKYEDGRTPVELLLQWARIRLNTAIKTKKETDRMEHDKHYTVPGQVLLYGQAAANTGLLQSRRRPHTTVPYTHPALPCLLTSASVSNFRQASYAAYLAPIPPVQPWVANPARKVWKAVSNDGTTSVYYPNGSLAVLVSHAGPGRKGYFLHAFDVGPASSKTAGRMLVTFTPYGRGTCYHSNGVLWFVSFDKGCSLHDSRGTRLRRYRWPAPTSKLPTSVILRLNDNLTFKCWSRSEMSLVFTVENSSVTFDLGIDAEAVESRSKEPDDLTFLISGTPFTSHTAKELIKPSGKKQKQRRPHKKMDRYKMQLAELQKSMDVDSHLYESVMDKELARVQRKMKRLCDDWLEHYRLSLGIFPPNINAMNDQTTPQQHRRKRLIKSAHHLSPINAMAIERATSAPLHRRPVTASTAVSMTTGTVVKFEDGVGEDGRPMTSLDHVPSPPPMIVIGAESALPQSQPHQTVTRENYSDLMQPVPCPVVCRALMMGLETAGCRCSRTKSPFITDLEYEYFLHRVIPREQLVIIGIVASSSVHSSPPCIAVLDALYERMNRNRPHPCSLSRHDDYRIFLYDLSNAAKTTPCTQALLLRRHNVVPGMCLMYQAGRLLFADQIFNGYSITRKDITKQIQVCRLQAMRGFALPLDFRFQATPRHSSLGVRKDRSGREHHVTLLIDGDDNSTSSLPLTDGQHLRASLGSSIVAYY